MDKSSRFHLTTFVHFPRKVFAQQTSGVSPYAGQDTYELCDMHSTSSLCPASASSTYSTTSTCERHSTETETGSTAVMRRAKLGQAQLETCLTTPQAQAYDKISPLVLFVDLWGCSSHKMYC